MLVGDLRPIAPDKPDGEVAERFNLALKLDPVRQKDGDFNSVIANVL